MRSIEELVVLTGACWDMQVCTTRSLTSHVGRFNGKAKTSTTQPAVSLLNIPLFPDHRTPRHEALSENNVPCAYPPLLLSFEKASFILLHFSGSQHCYWAVYYCGAIRHTWDCLRNNREFLLAWDTKRETNQSETFIPRLLKPRTATFPTSCLI